MTLEPGDLSRGADRRRRVAGGVCDPSDTHWRFVGWRFDPSPVRGWCFGGRRLQWGRGSGWRNMQSLSPMLLSSWPSTCEKLERWLVRLGTTLINRVDVGPKGGGGGAGGGMGVGVVGAEQQAATSDA